MDLTAEKIKVEPKDGEENAPDKYIKDGYTVRVGSHRILTVTAFRHDTATKWLKEVEKFNRTKTGPLLVGFSTSTESRSYKSDGNCITDPQNIPYDLLQICIGSQCLIYQLPDSYSYYPLKALQSFFANPNVIVVGVDMASVAQKLDKIHDIKVLNWMDVNELAVKAVMKGGGGKKEYRGLERCGLDRVAEVVCGGHVYVVRPRKEVAWYVEDDRNCFYCKKSEEELTTEKVKYATLDAYFCYRIGNEALRKIGPVSASDGCASSKKKKEKEKEKKT